MKDFFKQSLIAILDSVYWISIITISVFIGTNIK